MCALEEQRVNKEIRVSTQGVYNMKSGNALYREVLVRKYNSYIGADKIIRFVDVHHLDLEFDLDIIRSTLTKYNEITNESITLGINLCKRSLYYKGAAKIIADTIEKYKGNKIVVIEITENMDFYREELVNNIKILRERNIVVILDDFGTSRANLDTILDLKIQMVKIDKKYTDKMLSCGNTETVLSNLSRMLKNIGVEVIVEGVEKEEQLDALIHMGFENFQGFLMEKPVELI